MVVTKLKTPSLPSKRLLIHAMQGLVWFDFHFVMPHALECCFQAKNGAICISTPRHYVSHILEMVVPKCLTTSLPDAGH